jgi:hypothetical protein
MLDKIANLILNYVEDNLKQKASDKHIVLFKVKRNTNE